MIMQKYDVYVYETKPLEEGQSKHTLSVFVADEAGIINRVAGVIARRGTVSCANHILCHDA